jgi:hypothetical protein
MRKMNLLLLVLAMSMNFTSFAWIYPEHRDITILAIQKLDPARRNTLDQLWTWARTGYESRLDVSVANLTQSLHPNHLDFAAWPAISGDHSASPENMLYNVLQTDWILKVADIAARLKIGIAEAKNRSDRINRLRDSDLRLLRVDPEYVSRAGANYGHFMLALPEVGISASDYYDICYKEGSALNTIGTYKWFHASAMMKARRLSTEKLTPEQRSALALSILADEAFALHFLEDSFASGHVAGIWGDASQRKGTHDYYCEKGLMLYTWKGERIVILGDAYMRPEDTDRAAKTVSLSLQQVLDEASGTGHLQILAGDRAGFEPDTFNVSKAVIMPPRILDPAFKPVLEAVLVNLPVPGLATGEGEMPRFRSELGLFIGISPAARVSLYNGGFGESQKTAGFVPALELGLRLGLGMDGVMNESGDGLAFLDLGWRQDGVSSMKFANEAALKDFKAYSCAIPSRDAFYARLRLPFCLIPGDLLIGVPILYLFSPKTADKMIVAAGNGGLIPWQSGLITPIGRFQFILGREVGVCFYGSGRGPDAFLIPEIDEDFDYQILISMYSTQLDFPILEYRPFRTFSSRQSAGLVLQINAGIDIPGKVTVITGETTKPDLKTAWFIGFRVAFDWRYYFAKSKP